MNRLSFDAEWELSQGALYHNDAEERASVEVGRQAKDLYSYRRRREAEFGDATLFADPAWDILLSLIADESIGRSTSISAACISANIPPTTALRVIAKMERLKLVRREGDQFDKRRWHLRLSPRARAIMTRLLSAC